MKNARISPPPQKRLRSLPFRAWIVLQKEGWAGIRARLGRRREARYWERLERDTESYRSLVQAQISAGRDLYDGISDQQKRDLIRIKNEQAVNFQRRRATERGGITEQGVRDHLQRVLEWLGIGEEAFRGKSALEVGSGPTGILNWSGASPVYNLDPCVLGYSRYVPDFPKLLTNTRFIEGYAESIPLADASLDIVLCVNALDHFNDPAAALREFSRILKPDGLVLLNVDSKDRTLPRRIVKHVGHPFSITPERLREWVDADFVIAYERAVPERSSLSMHLKKRKS